MNDTERKALADAVLIKSRSDYETLPKEVREWVEWVIAKYGVA